MEDRLEKNENISMLFDEKKMNELKKKCQCFLNTNNDDYIYLYLLYRELFTKYIIDKLRLNSYDIELKKNPLMFIPLDKEKMDFYQYFSSDKLNFFYIRNNIYIEKLTKEELMFLNYKLQNKNLNLDNETEKFIEQTFRKVIFEDLLHDGSECIAFYGPNNSNFATENNTLVIGFRYDRFKNNGLEESEWLNLHDEQDFYLYNYIRKIEDYFQKNFSVPIIPIKIIQYNEFSVNIERKI